MSCSIIIAVNLMAKRGDSISTLLRTALLGLAVLLFNPASVAATLGGKTSSIDGMPFSAERKTPLDEKGPLQQQIDKARPGETIQIQAGEYRESLVITKPIHLVGSGQVTLIQQGNGPALSIETDRAKVENLTIIHEDRHSPALFISGDRNGVQHVRIYTQGTGLRLEEAHHNILAQLTIEGRKQAPFTERQHGIDLWRSDHNEISASRIRYVRDGIYLEKSRHNLIRENVVAHSRYGYHLMFTEKTVLERNEAYQNVSGMMIMGTVGTVAKQNRLYHHDHTVRSLGLLLFDVQQALISQNQIIQNRIGILIEDSRENELTQNNVQGNYLGLQFKKARENHIHHNTFVANVVQGQAEESHHNQVRHNYWGDHRGLDLSGEGTSNLGYTVDPFFLKITDTFPPFQLFFHSPGLIFLEQLIDVPLDEQFTDPAPLLENPLAKPPDQGDNPFPTLLLCVALILISTTLIYRGVRKG